MRDFHRLKVWEKSHAFAKAVYAACRRFPPEERFGLTSQLQRAAPLHSNQHCRGLWPR